MFIIDPLTSFLDKVTEFSTLNVLVANNCLLKRIWKYFLFKTTGLLVYFFVKAQNNLKNFAF